MNPEIILAIVLAALAVVAMQRQILKLDEQRGVLLRLDAKLDLLLKNTGIEYDPYKNLPPAVGETLRRGKKIEAIKLYRAATGVGLKEAKDAVEEILRRGG